MRLRGAISFASDVATMTARFQSSKKIPSPFSAKDADMRGEIRPIGKRRIVFPRFFSSSFVFPRRKDDWLKKNSFKGIRHEDPELDRTCCGNNAPQHQTIRRQTQGRHARSTAS
jgi:hypothetical protein